MRKPTGKQRARSAAEWSEIVTAFVRSGESPENFAGRHGVKPGTLKWWRTRLQPVRGRRALALAAAPRLVPVTVTRATDEARAPDGASWELRSAAGDVLRVEGELPIESLREVLGALTRPGRRR